MISFGSTVLAAEGASDDLKMQALRLIGNACADTGNILYQLSLAQ